MNANDHTQSIDVDVPVRVAYNQWTQFEEFPKFMEGVESITQLDDERLHWVVDIAGVIREFDTTISEQLPDERVAWTTTDGPTHAGVVTFHSLADDKTRVTLQMDFEPDGLPRDRRRQARLRERPPRRRHEELQVVHRGSWPVEWRLARDHREQLSVTQFEPSCRKEKS